MGVFFFRAGASVLAGLVFTGGAGVLVAFGFAGAAVPFFTDSTRVVGRTGVVFFLGAGAAFLAAGFRPVVLGWDLVVRVLRCVVADIETPLADLRSAFADSGPVAIEVKSISDRLAVSNRVFETQ
jgi:hypothetical protein